MRTNIIVIFLLVVVTSLSAIYWKVDHDFFNDKLLWNEAQSRSELSALTRSVQSELVGYSQVLDLTLPNLKNLKKDYDHDQVYSHFQMIATVVEQNSEIHLDQKYFLEGSSVKSWAATYVPLALQELRTAGNISSLGQNILLTISDPSRKTWILLYATSPVTQKQSVAILSADALQGIIDRQKGQMASVSILNHHAQVLGHAKLEYIGKALKDDPLAMEFMKSNNASGSGLFNSQGDRIQGFYEQVEGTNVVVTVSTPLRTLMMDRSKIKTRFLFMGVGISLLGIAMLMLLGVGSTAESTAEAKPVNAAEADKKHAEKPKEKTTEAPKPVAAAAAEVVVEKLPDDLPIPPVDKERTQSQEKFSELFSEQKINETLEMVDQLESPPPPPKFEPKEESSTALTKTVPMEVTESLPMEMTKTVPMETGTKTTPIDSIEMLDASALIEALDPDSATNTKSSVAIEGLVHEETAVDPDALTSAVSLESDPDALTKTLQSTKTNTQIPPPVGASAPLTIKINMAEKSSPIDDLEIEIRRPGGGSRSGGSS